MRSTMLVTSILFLFLGCGSSVKGPSGRHLDIQQPGTGLAKAAGHVAAGQNAALIVRERVDKSLVDLVNVLLSNLEAAQQSIVESQYWYDRKNTAAIEEHDQAVIFKVKHDLLKIQKESQFVGDRSKKYIGWVLGLGIPLTILALVLSFTRLSIPGLLITVSRFLFRKG